MGFTSELETSAEQIAAYVRKTADDPADPERAEVLLAVDQDIPEALGFIRSSMKRMDSLINEILKLSRAGRRVLEPLPVDMQGLVTECVDSIRQRFAEAGAECRSREGCRTSSPTALRCNGNLYKICSIMPASTSRKAGPARSSSGAGAGARARRYSRSRTTAAASPCPISSAFSSCSGEAGVQDRPGEGIGLAHTRMLSRHRRRRRHREERRQGGHDLRRVLLHASVHREARARPDAIGRRCRRPRKDRYRCRRPKREISGGLPGLQLAIAH